jgi:hypothetical protein
MKGKHAYLAPEQILAADTGCTIDQRTDLYSLGVILYELVTTTRPFEAENELSLIRSIVDAGCRPQPPRALAPWLDAGVEAAILRAMAREPSDRFDSAAEMRTAFAECLTASRQRPTERHVGSMLSLIFPAGEDSSRAATLVDESLPANAEPFDVPGPDVGADAPGSQLLRPAAPENQELGLSELAARAPGGIAPGQRRDSGVQARKGVPEATAELFGDTTGAGADPAGCESERHWWDLVLDKLQSARETQTQVASERAGVTQPAPAYSPQAMSSRSTAPPDIDPRRQARLEFERGLEHHRNHDTVAALQALERATALDPENRLYRTNLRLIRRRAGIPDGDAQDES